MLTKIGGHADGILPPRERLTCCPSEPPGVGWFFLALVNASDSSPVSGTQAFGDSEALLHLRTHLTSVDPC